MADTRLELQVVANAKAANSALEGLISTLGRVREAVKSGMNASSAGQSYVQTARSINRAMEAVDSGVTKFTSKIGAMASQAKAASANVASSASQMADQYANATSKVNLLRMKLASLRGSLTSGIESGWDSGKIANTALQIQRVKEQILKLVSANGSATSQISSAAMSMADAYTNTSSRIELLQTKLVAMKTQLASGIQAGWDDSKLASAAMRIQDLTAKIKKLQDAEQGAKTSTKSLEDRLRELGKSMSVAKGHSNNLLSSFIRIAKYRFLRSVLREITEGVTTGSKNMYEYAKAVGLSFAPAVDSAKDALLRMKNSIGAALAPLVEMLILYLMQAVEWFINLINVVNQFLALLHGQTEWTRAITATDNALEDVEASAGGAAKAIKEVKGLLADWDELNIIQQQPSNGGYGGGSGSAKKAETDYTKMFEQVDVFDGKIRDAVNWIKENIDIILDTAKLIGVAILGWNISTAFGGIIGTLTSWVTTGLIAALTFKVVTELDNKFLATGKPGWLIQNVLTTALGAGIAAKLVKHFISKNYASQAAKASAAIVLTFSAAADIVAAIGNVDVGALDPEFLALAVTGAAKGAVATGLVASAAGVDKATAGLYSLGALGTLFSVTVGVKAVLGAVDTGEINGDTIWSNIVSALSAGAGALFIAKGAGLTWPMASWIAAGAAGGILSIELGLEAIISDQNADISGINWPGIWLKLSSALAAAGATVALLHGALHWKIGESFLGGAAVGALLLAVELGVSAVVSTAKADTSGVTTEAIIKSLTGGLVAMGAVAGVAKYAGWQLPQAMAYGIGAAGIFLAVSLGVNAIVGTVNAKELTLNNVLAALGATAGAGIGTAAILVAGGASLGVAAAVGGGVALATGLVIAAAIGIALQVKEKEGIKWGNLNLTEEQIQTFVKEKMFSVETQTNLKLVNSKVEASSEELENIRQQAAELLTMGNVITLGVNEKDTVLEIHKQVQNLVTATELYAKTQTAVLRTGISVIPVINDAGEDISAEVLSKGITGWQGVTDYMGDLGKQLSDALIDGTTGELKTNWDTELVQTLLDKVKNVNRAVLESQTAGNAREGLGSTLFGLNDLSQESFTKVINSYTDYADELKSSLYNVYYQEVASFEQLAAYYNAMAENEAGTPNGEKYRQLAEEYGNMAEQLAADMETSVQEALDRELTYGKKMVSDWLMKMFEEPLKKPERDIMDAIGRRQGVFEQDFAAGMQEAISLVSGVPVEVFQLLNITGWDILSSNLQKHFYYALRSMFDHRSGIDVDVDAELASLGITLPVTPVIEEPDKDNQLNYEYDFDLFSPDGTLVLPAADTEQLTSSVYDAALSVSASIKSIADETVEAIKREISEAQKTYIMLSRGAFVFPSRTERINRNNYYSFASGGFPETGDYFLARESGPELVGTMGNRTAVANNDQIVSGIASGVAAAQQEQNVLLRQQNDYLRRLLAKESTVRVEPSSKWGKFQRQSEAMYARNTGTEG